MLDDVVLLLRDLALNTPAEHQTTKIIQKKMKLTAIKSICYLTVKGCDQNIVVARHVFPNIDKSIILN